MEARLYRLDIKRGLWRWQCGGHCPSSPGGKWGFQIACLITDIYGPLRSSANPFFCCCFFSFCYTLPPPLQNTMSSFFRCAVIANSDLKTGLLILAELLEGERRSALCALHRFALPNSWRPGGGIIPILRTKPRLEATRQCRRES